MGFQALPCKKEDGSELNLVLCPKEQKETMARRCATCLDYRGQENKGCGVKIYCRAKNEGVVKQIVR